MLFTAGLLLISLTLTTHPNVQPIKVDNVLKPPPEAAFQINPDQKLVGKCNKIVVREMRTTNVDSLMVVEMVLQNNRGRRDLLQYRFRWLDKNGSMTKPYASWETAAFEGYEESVLRVVAPNPDTVDFRFEMRKGQ